jgi:hypothetical protein
MSGGWQNTTSWAEVCARAGGRKRYNAARKHRKQARRAEIICRTDWRHRDAWGLQAALAKALGVSKATICRDFKAIRNADRGALLT